MHDQNGREASLFVAPLMQLLMGALLFVAVMHSQRTLVIAAVLILGLTGLAKIWSGLSSSRVTCLFTVDKDRIFPGENFTMGLRAENKSFLPVWVQAGPISFAGLISSPGEGMPSVKQSGLLGYQGVRFQWALAAWKRGVYHVGAPRLRVGDFLGFSLREHAGVGPIDIMVYPRLISLKPLSLPHRDLYGAPGAESPVRDPVYILGTRDYQHNQPARHIHWKASVRHDRLQEKVFEPTAQKKVLLVLEVGQFAERGADVEFEHTLEVIASLAVQLDRKGAAVGLATNGMLTGEGPSFVPVAVAPLHLSAVLEILARVRMVKKSDLVDVLHKGLSLTWGVSCIHFSRHLDASARIAENYFIMRKAMPLFVVCRPDPESLEDEHRIQSRTCSLDDLRVERTKE